MTKLKNKFMDKNHTVVDITKEATDAKFTDCKFYGSLKNSGKRSKFIRTEIGLFRKEHPFFFWLSVVASVTGILAFFM